jgi:hypothetical protein
MKKVKETLNTANFIVKDRSIEKLYKYLKESANGKNNLGKLLDTYEEIGRSKRNPKDRKKHIIEKKVEDVRKDLKKLASEIASDYRRSDFKDTVIGFKQFFKSSNHFVKDGDMMGFLRRTYKFMNVFDKHFKRSKIKELARTLGNTYKYLAGPEIKYLIASMRSETKLREDINKKLIHRTEDELKSYTKFAMKLNYIVVHFIP